MPSALRLSSCTVDLGSRRVTRPDGVVTLTTMEAGLLVYLADRLGRDVSTEELLREVWKAGPQVVSRAVFHTARRLRQKIELDPSRPVHLLAVHGTGYRLVAEANAPSPTRSLDRFVGRAAELAALTGWVDGGERLISVVGPSGCGKTRLLERWLEDRPGAVGCSLAHDDLAAAVAHTLSVPLGPDPAAQLGDALAARGPVVVGVDDWRPAAAPVVTAWLARAPQLVVVVAAYEPLRVPGERSCVLGPLPLDEARALFVDRAGAADPPEQVDLLLRALDGFPLEIELAALRARAFGAAGVRERLEDRFRILADPSGQRAPRHRRLDAAIDWSVSVLDPEEASVLAQLTVFADGFTLAAAERVVDTEVFVPDAVQRLIERGFVSVGPTGRFGLRGTVRRWLVGRTPQPPAVAGAARRHRAVFAELADQHSVLRRGISEPLRADRANLRAALEAALRDDAPDEGLRLARCVLSMLATEGPFDEVAALEARCRRWYDRSPALAVDVSLAAREGLKAAGDAHRAAELDEGAAAWLDRLGQPAMAAAVRANADCAPDLPVERIPAVIEALASALPAARRDAPSHVPALLANLGLAHGLLGRFDDAARALEDALAADPDVRTRSTSLANLGIARSEQGRVDEAEELFEQALASARAAGDVVRELRALGNLAQLLTYLGRAAEGLDLATAVDAARAANGMPPTMIEVRALAHLLDGQVVEALACLRSALDLHRRRQSPGLVACCASIAECGWWIGRPELAAERLAEARAFARDGSDEAWLALAAAASTPFRADPAAAEAAARLASADLRAGPPDLALRVAVALGMWAVDRGDLDAARDRFAAVVGSASVSAGVERNRARVWLARIERAAGQLDRARGWLEALDGPALPGDRAVAHALWYALEPEPSRREALEQYAARTGLDHPRGALRPWLP